MKLVLKKKIYPFKKRVRGPAPPHPNGAQILLRAIGVPSRATPHTLILKTQLAWPNSRQNRASKRDIVNYVEREAEVLTKKLAKSVLAVVSARAASKL